MSEYLELGPTPADEQCEQLGRNYNPTKARAECRAYVHQLQREFPDGRFGVKSFPHDFGNYLEVVAYFSNEHEAEVAYQAEDSSPNWDSEAIAELAEHLIPA